MFLIKAKTAWALGVPNVVRFLAYKYGLKSGLNPVQRLQAKPPSGPFFRPYAGPIVENVGVDTWENEVECFGWFRVPLNGKCPEWHTNPLNGVRSRFDDKPWWIIPDFDPELGDIKTVWETSRWAWVLDFAKRAQSGDPDTIARLNAWLADWNQTNPPYSGVNWKCGQEASIRVMHVAMAAVILNQYQNPLPGLVELIRVHLQRIAPTILYAVSQNNNHGISEAAALFIGGTWLDRITADRRARKWASMGRRWMENRLATLVEDDGSFSQYSVNYHRVLLDSISMVEIWRRHVGLPLFSEAFVACSKKATNWLETFVDTEKGEVPNIGANDGARLFPICRTGYCDYRPSVQLASILFAGTTIYSDGPWNESLKCFGIPVPATRKSQAVKSRIFDNGGYAVLCQGKARVYMRYPRFRFRPGHADAMHVDLWIGSRNLLRDGGSFSYADNRLNSYFCGTESHSTVQFDGRDQMPQVGRFLYGEWLRSLSVGPLEESDACSCFSASYRDCFGAHHYRKLNLSASQLCVVDQVEGFKESAVLRWRLETGEWSLDGYVLSLSHIRIQVTASVEIKSIKFIQGYESKYYLRKEELPVLEVKIDRPGNLETIVTWSCRDN